MLIRPYHPDDRLRLAAIHDAARLDELAASNLQEAFETFEPYAERDGLFNAAITVAEIDGTVKGFAAVADGELTWLYVDPHACRQGIGRALVRHAVDAAEGSLSADVLLGNEAALQLYLTEGFNVLRRVDGRLNGNNAFPASGYALQYNKPTA